MNLFETPQAVGQGELFTASALDQQLERAVSLQVLRTCTLTEGDDVCDTCGRTGVTISRTDENGDTVCEDCDEECGL